MWELPREAIHKQNRARAGDTRGELEPELKASCWNLLYLDHVHHPGPKMWPGWGIIWKGPGDGEWAGGPDVAKHLSICIIAM